MLKSISLTCGLSALALVALSSFNRARAEAMFHAIDIHTRLYQNSDTYPVALGEDGIVVTEEYNTSNRGYIQNFVIDPLSLGSIRFDDVVGTPSRPVPAGLIGGARFSEMSINGGLRYRYLNTNRVFLPEGPLGSTIGTTFNTPPMGNVFNASHFASSDIGFAKLSELPTPTFPSGRLLGSVAVPNADPEYGAPNLDSMNMDSRLAGSYFDGSLPRGQIPFIWQPDLSGATEGQLEVLPSLRRTYRGAEFTTLQSAHGESVVVNIMNNSSRAPNLYESFVWTPGESESSLVRLNDLFGKDDVVVYDINSTGTMVGHVGDADGANQFSFLYSSELGFVRFDSSLIENGSAFAPRWINDAGEIAGFSTYQQALPNGNSIVLNKAVLLRPIPEPASLACCGLAIVSLRARRR